MVRVVTCCPQADLKFWNLSTFPPLNAYSVSINHCLSVFLRDSKTGCMSCRQMHRQGHEAVAQVIILYIRYMTHFHSGGTNASYQFPKVVHSLPQESSQAQCEGSLLLFCLCGHDRQIRLMNINDICHLFPVLRNWLRWSRGLLTLRSVALVKGQSHWNLTAKNMRLCAHQT